MKLSKYAKKLGVSYQTAHRMYAKGQIPGAYQLPTGTIIVPDDIAFPEEMTQKALVKVVDRYLTAKGCAAPSDEIQKAIDKLESGGEE